jgi:hypothetical protein
MEDSKPASLTDMSLSAAMLAPLNAIFEAQVHAARSFLSFILQMGFRHKYSEDEIEKLRQDKTANKEILNNISQEETARLRIEELRKLKKDGTISEENLTELRLLVNQWDDIYSQDFIHIDDQGNENWVTIPNLALIPVKPLSIDTASFKFDMAINSSYETYNTIRSSTNVESDRPWFLIKPKRLTGSIVPKNSSASQSSISIEISIKSTEMPYGLNKLLTMMTENSRILPVDTIPENKV